MTYQELKTRSLEAQQISHRISIEYQVEYKAHVEVALSDIPDGMTRGDVEKEFDGMVRILAP